MQEHINLLPPEGTRPSGMRFAEQIWHQGLVLY